MIRPYGQCKRCQSFFRMVEFLAYRQTGYCSFECSVGEPPAVASIESRAWKDKILTASLKEKLQPLPNQSAHIEQPGYWIFDMVHYPPPKGWQIENWRFINDP